MIRMNLKIGMSIIIIGLILGSIFFFIKNTQQEEDPPAHPEQLIDYQSTSSNLKLSAEEIAQSAVRLHVFTSEDQNKTFEIKYNHKVGRFSQICPQSRKPLIKLIMHGFAEKWNMSNRWNWVGDMTYELLKTPEASKLCIVVVDWKELANGGSEILSNYWRAISNMQIMGDLVTEFFRWNEVNEANMHCIGFSLGAHACGVFNKIYFNKLRVKPGRITGLDPAGPFFSDRSIEEKLAISDAVFVDVIHTSAKFGLDEKTGHMDFYQDDGASGVNACDDLGDRMKNHTYIIYEDKASKRRFLGFKNITFSGFIEGKDMTVKLVKSKVSGLFDKVKDFFLKTPSRIFLRAHQFFGCSHLMSMRFFLYSINRCEFKAKYCRDKEHYKKNECFSGSKLIGPFMGYYADRSSEFYKRSNGSFFLKTKSERPYCIK